VGVPRSLHSAHTLLKKNHLDIAQNQMAMAFETHGVSIRITMSAMADRVSSQACKYCRALRAVPP